MREIKFRAYLPDEHKIVRVATVRANGTAIEYRDESGYHGREVTDSTSELDKAILMQSTGLEDRNGIEIYEGDLVSDGTMTYIVKWVGSGLVMWISDQYWRFIDFDDNVLVIGNIYENPDLLSRAPGSPTQARSDTSSSA